MSSTVDFSHYEPLEGQRPYRLLDRHPSGDYLALAIPGERTRAAVWESQTGKLLWSSEGGVLIAWLQHGSQIVLLRQPLSGESLTEEGEAQYIFERQSWPDGGMISQCPVILFRWSDPISFIISPHGNLIVLRWLTQGASGWEFILLRETGDFHLKEAGIEIDSEVAAYTEPGFSPDGHYAVSGYYTLSRIRRRRRYEVGCVTVICLFNGTSYQIPIADVVSVKLHGTAARSFDPPVFLDNKHFLVMLPTGAKRTYHV